MDFDVIGGALLFGLGLVSLVPRFVPPGSGMFKKREEMKERYGEARGNAIHIVAYTFAPLIMGGVLPGRALLSP